MKRMKRVILWVFGYGLCLYCGKAMRGRGYNHCGSEDCLDDACRVGWGMFTKKQSLDAAEFREKMGYPHA